MKSEKVRKHFQKWAKEYDISEREKMIPGFYDFYGAVVDMVSQKRNIMELGTGTGMLTELILASYPDVRINGIDLTNEMLIQAEKKLRKYKDRLSLKSGDFNTIHFGNNYDAVVSSLSIHHLTSNDKKKLYKKIFNSLKKGGVFINADMVKSESGFIQKLYLTKWKNFMRRGNVSKESIKRRLQGVKKVDIYDTAQDQLTWLKKAGFKSVDVFWKYWNFAVFGGFKT